MAVACLFSSVSLETQKEEDDLLPHPSSSSAIAAGRETSEMLDVLRCVFPLPKDTFALPLLFLQAPGSGDGQSSGLPRAKQR